MKLWGRYNSPYVRRVAVTMQFYGLDYNHESVIPFEEGKKDVAKKVSQAIAARGGTPSMTTVARANSCIVTFFSSIP